MGKQNIFTNYSLEGYNKKFHNRRNRLLKFTKKEVEDFDKKNNSNEKFLLKNRKWAYIDGTYYEIPKAPRFTWFRNLHAGVQVGACVLAAGVVATAVTVPVVLMNANKEVELTLDQAIEYCKTHYDANGKLKKLKREGNYNFNAKMVENFPLKQYYQHFLPEGCRDNRGFLSYFLAKLMEVESEYVSVIRGKVNSNEAQTKMEINSKINGTGNPESHYVTLSCLRDENELNIRRVIRKQFGDSDYKIYLKDNKISIKGTFHESFELGSSMNVLVTIPHCTQRYDENGYPETSEFDFSEESNIHFKLEGLYDGDPISGVGTLKASFNV